MHSNVPEINMKQLSISPFENRKQLVQFSRRYLPWRLANLLKPKTSQKVRCRFSDNVDGRKGKSFCLLALLCDDDRAETFERCDLPVDVQHLRLQKRRAITGDDRSLRHCAGTICLARQNRRVKNLIPLHLPG